MIAQPEPVGLGQSCFEELDDRLDRVALDQRHRSWIGPRQERDDHRHAELGGNFPHLFGLHPFGGVQHGGPGGDRPSCYLDSPGVDAQRHTELGQCRHERLESLPFDRPADHLGDIGRALPTEIDPVSAGAHRRVARDSAASGQSTIDRCRASQGWR